jgi:hypothetical protein
MSIELIVGTVRYVSKGQDLGKPPRSKQKMFLMREFR